MAESDPVTVAVRQIKEVPAGCSLEHINSELSISQHAALGALTNGATYKAAAEAAGVHRMTLYRWMNSDPFFRAAFNVWQQELRQSARDQLLRMAEDAINTVGKAVAEGDRKLAYNLLKDLGLLSKQKDAVTEPGLLRQQMEEQCRQQEKSLAGRSAAELLRIAGLGSRKQRQLLQGVLERESRYRSMRRKP